MSDAVIVKVRYAGREFDMTLPEHSKVIIADDYPGVFGVGVALPSARRDLIAKLATKLGVDPTTIDVGLGPGVVEGPSLSD